MNQEERLNIVKKLLLKQLTGEISAQEKDTLQQWMKEDKALRELAERVSSQDFLQHAILDTCKEEQQQFWHKLAKKIGVRRTFRLSPRLRTAAAAVLIFLMCGTASYYYYNNVDEPVIKAGSSQAVFRLSGKSIPLEGNTIFLDRMLKEQMRPEHGKKEISPELYAHIDVPHGGEYRIVLEDSTRIHLNSGSSLYVSADFSPSNRNISLAGEAYLEVHPDARHPFTVHTEKADIRVLGTTLNIEAYEDDPTTTVTLLNGHVELLTGKERTEIPVGHAAVIDETRHVDITAPDLYECTAWHNGRIVFNDRPMEEIMRKLGRWYNITPAFGNDRLRNLRITVDIDKGDSFNRLAQLIERLNEVHIRITRRRVLLSETPH